MKPVDETTVAVINNVTVEREVYESAMEIATIGHLTFDEVVEFAILNFKKSLSQPDWFACSRACWINDYNKRKQEQTNGISKQIQQNPDEDGPNG